MKLLAVILVLPLRCSLFALVPSTSVGDFHLHDSVFWSPCASLVRLSILIFLGKGMGERPPVAAGSAAGVVGALVGQGLVQQAR